MRHLPNDIITEINPDNTGAYLYSDGDALYGMSGRDRVSLQPPIPNSYTSLYGDAF